MKASKIKKTDNKSTNLKQLRVYLRLTQKQLLEACSDKHGDYIVSVATLSNLESKGGAALDMVVSSVANAYGLDESIFELSSLEFLEVIERHFAELEEAEEIISSDREDSITSLVNRLTEYFADKMFDGEINRGDQIEPDRVLAEKFDVGRSALREAMKVLHVMGLVDIRPGQGTFISTRETDIFEIPILWSLFLSSSQVDQILMLRGLLEGQAAALAAGNIDEAKRKKLGRIISDSLDAYNDRDESRLLELDVEFHTTIAECSGNHIIYAQILTIRSLLKRVSRTGMDEEEQLRQIYEEHKEIYEYICADKVKEAQSAMHKHLDNSKERYRIG